MAEIGRQLCFARFLLLILSLSLSLSLFLVPIRSLARSLRKSQIDLGAACESSSLFVRPKRGGGARASECKMQKEFAIVCPAGAYYKGEARHRSLSKRRRRRRQQWTRQARTGCAQRPLSGRRSNYAHKEPALVPTQRRRPSLGDGRRHNGDFCNSSQAGANCSRTSRPGRVCIFCRVRASERPKERRKERETEREDERTREPVRPPLARCAKASRARNSSRRPFSLASLNHYIDNYCACPAARQPASRAQMPPVL